MIKLLLYFLLFQTSKPVAANVAAGCATNAACTYTDTNVKDGVTYTYFVEATANGNTSPASNLAIAVIPADGATHSVVLNWDPVTNTTGVSYEVFRTSPPSDLQITTQ